MRSEWEHGIQYGYGELFTPQEGLRKGRFVNNVLMTDDHRGETPKQKLKKKKQGVVEVFCEESEGGGGGDTFEEKKEKLFSVQSH